MLPLKGVKVISVEQYGAGPLGSLHLADFGAEVIRVEDPGTKGDAARYMAAPFKHVAVESDSLFFQCLNRNKKSITLNLHHTQGRDIFEKLVKDADVVFNNLRGDLPDKMGLTYEKLKDINSRIVCCTLSAWGREGEWARLPGYDYLLQGMCGVMSLTGEPSGPPVRSGISFIDCAAAIAAAFAITAGLIQVQQTGRGLDLDTSLLQTAAAQLSHLAVWNLNGGYKPVRNVNSADSMVVPAQNFFTNDGWIAVVAVTDESWRNLCLGLENAELLQDERFNTLQDRNKNKNQLIKILSDIFPRETTDHWIKRLGELKVPVAKINSIDDALNEEEIKKHILEIQHEDFGTLRESKSSASCPGSNMPHTRAPKLGEHTDEILKCLSFTVEDISSLRKEGVI